MQNILERVVKALVFNGPKNVRYGSFEDPERSSANTAIVKVNHSNIRGSDLQIHHGDPIGKAVHAPHAAGRQRASLQDV